MKPSQESLQDSNPQEDYTNPLTQLCQTKVQCCVNPHPEINNSCHGNDVMQVLCQNAVNKCIMKPSYGSVLQIPLRQIC